MWTRVKLNIKEAKQIPWQFYRKRTVTLWETKTIRNKREHNSNVSEKEGIINNGWWQNNEKYILNKWTDELNE